MELIIITILPTYLCIYGAFCSRGYTAKMVDRPKGQQQLRRIQIQTLASWGIVDSIPLLNLALSNLCGNEHVISKKNINCPSIWVWLVIILHIGIIYYSTHLKSSMRTSANLLMMLAWPTISSNQSSMVAFLAHHSAGPRYLQFTNDRDIKHRQDCQLDFSDTNLRNRVNSNFMSIIP